MDTNVKIEVIGDEVTIRTGAALPLKEPVKIEITGTINAPLDWMKSHEVSDDSHVLVDAEKATITLIDDHKSAYASKVCGKLEVSPEFTKFGINGEKFRTPLEMSEFIKMNRAYFENRSVAMELVAQLRNFTAKINKQVEQEHNQNKGDKRVLIAQVVDSNVPSSFQVKLPIFKGEDPIIFEVETYFNPDDLTCKLVSADANERAIDTRAEVIEQVITQMLEIKPDLCVIRQ